MEAPPSKRGKHTGTGVALASATHPPNRLSLLPSAVLLHLSDSFLLDSDAARAARSSHAALQTLKHYKFKGRVPMQEALKFRIDNGAAASPAQSESPVAAAAAAAVSVPAAATADAVPVESMASLPPLRSAWRFGQVRHVHTLDYGSYAQRLHLLPSSVVELQLAWERSGYDEVGGDEDDEESEYSDGSSDRSDEESGVENSQIQRATPYPPPPPDPVRPPPPLLGALPQSMQTLVIDRARDGVQHNDRFIPQPPPGWSLPPSLTQLTVGFEWDRLTDLQLPDGLLELVLQGDDYSDDPVSPALPPLPESLTKLDLGNTWKGAALPPQWPRALTELNLSRYAGPLDKLQLPESLQKLTLNMSEDSTQNVSDLRLPLQLPSLCFGSFFNCSLEGLALPASLTELHFDAGCGATFNLPVEHLRLPEGLRSLRLPISLAHPVAALSLPASLTQLRLSRKMTSALPPLAHTSLQELDMSHVKQPYRHNWAKVRFPPSLHTFTAPRGQRITASMNALFATSHLTHLDFSECESNKHHLLGVCWPPQLRKLKFDRCQSSALLTAAHWQPPVSLTELHFSYFLPNKPVSDILLPPALEVLHMGGGKQSLRSLQLPATLRELHLSWDLPVTELLPQPLPPGLQGLHFGSRFNRPVNGLQLPPGLQALHFGDSFNQPVAELQLPASLRELSFGTSFLQPLSQLPLPPGLQKLSLHGTRRRDSLRWWLRHSMDKAQTLPPLLPASLRVLAASRQFIDKLLNGEQSGQQLPPACVLQELPGDLR